MELNNGNIFKWWYAKDVITYKELLEGKTAHIIAMTRDGKVVRKMAPLTVENKELAVADCGLEGRFYLTPNQWVSPQKTETITKYWLIEQESQDPNTPTILGIYTSIDDNMAVMLPKGVELFGNSSSASSTLVHSLVDAIVPVGDEKCIAYSGEGNTCTFIGDRETDENAIKICLDRIHR